MTTVMTLSGPSKVGESSKAVATKSVPASNGKAKPSAVDDQDSDSDVNSELEEQERVASRKSKGKGKANGVKAFEQRDLVALAFAGDNVVQVRLHDDPRETIKLIRSKLQDFADAKRREIAQDAPKEVDTTLAGWVRSSHYSLPIVLWP